MKKLMLIMCGIAMVTVLNAKPAFRGPINRVQPDGSTITVYMHGDEFFHWETNDKGEWLTRDENGKYVKTAALTDEQITAQRKASRYYIPQSLQQAQPTNLAPRGLIILVNFKDVQFQSTNTLDIMRDMHNGDNYTYSYEYNDPYEGTHVSVTAQGSAKKYFVDQSGGRYQPYFDVVGPYTVSQDMAYYGKNDSYGNDKNPHVMVKEACELAHNDGVNFAQYDNDKNGYVDFVYVIYAGYGEADGGAANTIWPHSWNIYTKGGISLKLDGKQVDLYACSSELNYYSKKRAGIATFCHEFSHVLGLPDLYSTNGASHKTSGSWDVMDYGPYNNDGNTPPSYSGYERLFFGWTTGRVPNAPLNMTIKELQEFNDVCVITSTGSFNDQGNDPNPTEFYIIENRQQKGWDQYLPGHGMILTKVKYSYDYWTNNKVNNNSSDMRVDIIEADGLKPSYNQNKPDNGYMGKPGDAFPAGATSYSGITDYPITDITETDGVIHFKVKGGGPEGIETLNTDEKNAARKVFENGHVLIIRDGVKYSLLGEKL